MRIETRLAVYDHPADAAAITQLLDCYARDPMGGGQGLSEEARVALVPALAQFPQAFSILCFVDGNPVGLTNCFASFSTFTCKPIVNIHDIALLPEARGLGLCQRMLALVEEVARERGCCKITLEVLEGNIPAQKAYRKCGFDGYELDPTLGRALFWEKSLSRN